MDEKTIRPSPHRNHSHLTTPTHFIHPSLLTSVVLRDSVIVDLGEGDVAEVEDARHNVENVHLQLSIDVHHLHGMLHKNHTHI